MAEFGGGAGAELRVFGVRHHGPGSARALLAALAAFAPDCVLVEGPPDADDLIPWLAHPALEPPVALLVYRPDEPRRATFYPFAVFSPEYQALRFALERGAAVGFMDLPRRHTLATDVAAAMPSAEMFNQLAAAAGRDGYEPWWNEAVEQRRTAGELFAAVVEMAAELRHAAVGETFRRNVSLHPADDQDGETFRHNVSLHPVADEDDETFRRNVSTADAAQRLADAREAAMRQIIRRAAADGHCRIAAICGAWHAPALLDALTGPTAGDDALLRDLPAVEVAATWVPWTYGRMTQAGGYGAGVASPGWYGHLWEEEQGLGVRGQGPGQDGESRPLPRPVGEGWGEGAAARPSPSPSQGEGDKLPRPVGEGWGEGTAARPSPSLSQGEGDKLPRPVGEGWGEGAAARPSPSPSQGEGDWSRVAVGWLAKVGRLLREEGFDTSPGHLIEAVRLAEALAALRERPFPALDELNEAAQSVLCGGDAEPMALIRRRLIVGERMGVVPPDVPAVPLQRDLRAQQTRLRLRPEPEPSTLRLDLRQEMHLERSRLLHRLDLLDIPWGAATAARGQAVGTYAELWQLRWRPDLSLRVIEAAPWGNTVRDAAAARTADLAQQATDLPALIGLIDRAIPADLPEAIPAILARIEELSAISTDLGHGGVAPLLAALPPLAQTVRYGGLRHSADHLPRLQHVFDHLLTRACLALPRACLSLDDDAAREMADRLSAAAPAVALVGEPRAVELWVEALVALADRRGVHAVVAGRATRLLHESAAQPPAAIGLRLGRALAGGGAAETRYAAGWLDGLLRDSGLLLVHDRALWAEIDGWLGALPDERFVEALPLLRRTFAEYPDGVREQLRRLSGRRVVGAPAAEGRAAEFDPARAAAALPVIGRLLGLNWAGEEGVR